MAVLGSVDIPFTNAKLTANNAQTTATDAGNTASAAQTTATGAATAAATAQQTANDAKSAAEAAQATADNAMSTADGNIYYVQQNAPSSPKAGQMWYQTNSSGVVVAIKDYDGSQWTTRVDQAGINSAVEQASSDSASALSQAQSAVDTANAASSTAASAAQDASTAINTANSASSAASAASQTASDAASQASTAVSNAQTAMSNAQSALDGLDDKADKSTTYTKTEVDNALNAKVSQTDFDTLSGTVSTQATQISQNQTDIASKADKATVDTLSQTVSSQGTAISQNATAITSKADQSTVDALTGRVSTAEATLTTQANEIAARITTTDANAKYATQTALTATSSSLTSQITTAVNNVQVGGTNLIYNSSGYLGVDGWTWDSQLNFGTHAHDYESWFPYNSGFGASNAAQQEHFAYSSHFKLQYGQEYTLQFKAYVDFNTSGDIYILTPDSQIIAQMQNVNSGFNKITFTAPNDASSDDVFIRLDNNGSKDGTGDYTFVGYAEIKLELGNKATDWSPAPEDMATASQFSQLQQTVDGISTIVSNKVDTSTYNSYVSQTASTIATLLTKSDAAGTYATQTALTATSNSLTSQISQVQTNLDNVQVGGRNLLLNSNFADGDWDTWSNWGTCNREVVTVSNNNKKYIHLSQNDTAYFRGINQKINGIMSGETYTLSFMAYAATSGMVMTTGFHHLDGGTIVTQSWHDYTLSDTTKKFVFTLTATTSTIDAFNFMIGNSGSPFDIYITDIKLEQGNKATDWSPAPEDMATASQFSQLSNDINLRVSKNDVINQINVSTESILIAGNKVHITGQTTIDNAVIKDAMIQSISADKISATTLSAISANLGNVTAGNISGTDINIGGKFHVDTSGNLTATNANISGNINAITGSLLDITISGLITLPLLNDTGDRSKGIQGSYDLTEGEGSYKRKKQVGNNFIGGAYTSFVSKQTDIETGDSYYGATFYGASGVKLRSYETSSTNDYLGTLSDLNARIDILPGSITMGTSQNGGTDWPDNIKINADGSAKFGNLSIDGSKHFTNTDDQFFIIGKANSSDGSPAGAFNGYSGSCLLSTDSGGNLKAGIGVGYDSTGNRLWSLDVYYRTYSFAPNMVITDQGTIGRSTSATRYKDNIQYNVTLDDAKKILNVQPASWYDKAEDEALARAYETGKTDADDRYVHRHIGFIAEDVANSGLTDFVSYGSVNEDGSREIEGIEYDRLPVLHNLLIHDLYQQIEALKAQVSLLQGAA